MDKKYRSLIRQVQQDPTNEEKKEELRNHLRRMPLNFLADYVMNHKKDGFILLYLLTRAEEEGKALWFILNIFPTFEELKIIRKHEREQNCILASCPQCNHNWCDFHDPVAVSWGCHWCHGRGYSKAPFESDHAVLSDNLVLGSHSLGEPTPENVLEVWKLIDNVIRIDII